MFSTFTHFMKPVHDTNSEPGLPVPKQTKRRKGRKNHHSTENHRSVTCVAGGMKRSKILF